VILILVFVIILMFGIVYMLNVVHSDGVAMFQRKLSCLKLSLS